MSDFNWCHGPNCHEKHTVDRVRGVKGSKVLRTRKIKLNQYIDLFFFEFEIKRIINLKKYVFNNFIDKLIIFINL